MSPPSFTVSLSEVADGESRKAKRVIIHTDNLKSLKLCSGDVVALSQVDNGSSEKVRIGGAGNTWPPWYFRMTYCPRMAGLRGWSLVALYRCITEL